MERKEEIVFEYSRKRGSSEFTICSKMGIDATLKIGGTERPSRGDVSPVKPPKEILLEIERKWAQLGLGSI